MLHISVLVVGVLTWVCKYLLQTLRSMEVMVSDSP